MKKDIKYIIKRVIIGICIGLFFLLFKSCDVYAWTSVNAGQVNTYFQTQNCYFINNQFSCENGYSYKFTSPWQQNQNAIEWDVFPPFTTTDNAVLINNLIYEFIPTNSITTSSSRKSIGIGISSNGYISTSGTGSSMNFSIDMFPYLTRDENNNYIYNETFPMNYNFKPYYCTYYNGSEWVQCNLILEIGNSNVFYFVLDLQEGITIEKIRLYFGSPNRQTTLAYKTLGSNNIKVPDNNNIFYTNSNLNSISAFYVNYNDWRQHSNDNNIGLWWYPQGVSTYLPKFTMPTSNFTLQFDSNSYVNNTYKYNYDNLSNELKQQYTEQPENIEIEIENQFNTDDDIDSVLSSNYEGFINNEHSRKYITTIENLFAYPIQKLREQLTYDLVNHNAIIGANQIDSKLCWGIDTVTGDVSSSYRIQFFRDYSFNLPCPHSDIYTHLGYGTFGFYPPSFMGANNTGYNHDFISIWLIIQHGVLIYLLMVTILNFYKYILDSNKAEIEVLEI